MAKSLNLQIDELEQQQFELSKKIAAKKRALHKQRYNRDDYLEFSVFWTVNGIIEGKRVEFERGVSIRPPSFEWFLEHCMIIESLRQPGNTSMDYVISRYAKKFNINAAEKERLMQKYWHKKRETIADLVANWVKWEKEYYETEELFIEDLMATLLRRFEYAPTEIKYGLLYYIFKVHEKSDFTELQKDIEAVPEKIKLLIDKLTDNAQV